MEAHGFELLPERWICFTMVPIAKPLRQHIDSLPAGDQPGTPIHPEAFTIISRHGRSANLSNHFADLLAQAGLRERAPHHWSKGKGRNSQRASNSLSFHSLRHTAVSLLKDAGIPEGVIMGTTESRLRETLLG